MTDKAKSLPAVEWQAHNSGARLRSMWCDAYNDGHWTICNADGTKRLAEGNASGGLAGAKRAVEERLTWPRETGNGDAGTAQMIAQRDAEITRLLATLDAWRLATGADTPEALAAELAAYRASVRHGARHA